MPKDYRDYTDQELFEEYEAMREEFAKMTFAPDSDGTELLDFLEKNKDLIDAVGVVDKKRFEEKLAEK